METENPRVIPLSRAWSGHLPGRVSICWGRGNTLKVSFLESEESSSNQISGGKVVEVKLNNVDGGVSDEQWCRVVQGSVDPFALLQSRKDSFQSFQDENDWWEHVMEYSREIRSLLDNSDALVSPAIEDPKMVLKRVDDPTPLKASWELLEIFYADKHSETWIPERLVDWLSDFDCLFSGSLPTVHEKLMAFQTELVSMKAVENDPSYWEAMSSALSVGWLDIVVKLLRLHGSYLYDQLGSREKENGLVEVVALLISQMPRMRPNLPAGKLGECYKSKPEFMRAWEKWRTQITKLDCSAFWLQCEHKQTRLGLKNMLQVLLGNTSTLSNSTYHWIELFVSQFLYIRPFTMGLDSTYSLARKCMQLKPVSGRHKLMDLLNGILEDNTEVVLAGCVRSFGPWMTVHAIELLTSGNSEADAILHEERAATGGICIEELHRLIYAQILASHPETWTIAPIYLTSCMKQGLGLLENLLYQLPVQNQQILKKSLEICRLYALDHVGYDLMKIAGVHYWKHGQKGLAVHWLQQAQDKPRLNWIAKQLFDFVGKSLSDEGFKQWEGILDLLGTESETAGGLQFLKKYREFRQALQEVQDGVTNDAAKKAAEALISLMKNPSTPRQFWLPLLFDSLKILNWNERPLLNVSETNLLLNKLQEFSLARLLPGFSRSELPPEAVKSIRLALATNLGRAILEE